MGLCGAGMTNIVNRYALGRYDDCSYATTGSNYARKIIKIKNEPVVLDRIHQAMKNIAVWLNFFIKMLMLLF